MLFLPCIIWISHLLCAFAWCCYIILTWFLWISIEFVQKDLHLGNLIIYCLPSCLKLHVLYNCLKVLLWKNKTQKLDFPFSISVSLSHSVLSDRICLLCPGHLVDCNFPSAPKLSCYSFGPAKTGYQFLSPLLVWGRDFLIGPSSSGSTTVQSAVATEQVH